MSEIALSQIYLATDPELPPSESLFGYAFYNVEVGFGKIEEGFSEDGEPATIVSFADDEAEPIVNIYIREATPNLAIMAIEKAIAARNQLAYFA